MSMSMWSIPALSVPEWLHHCSMGVRIVDDGEIKEAMIRVMY